MDTKDKMQKMMQIVEEQMPDEGRLCIHMILNDGHHDEWSANYKISKMVPVAWLGVEKDPSCMSEYLTMLGITPMVAKDMVYNSYEIAKTTASKHDFSAPKLNANEWDCYWCIAMCIADYWATHMGDIEVASMLAYQYLSDPDR